MTAAATGPAGVGIHVRAAVAADAERLLELLALGSVPGSAPAGPPDATELAGARDVIEEAAASARLAVLVAVSDAAADGSDAAAGTVAGTVVGMCQLITFRHLQHGGGRCAELESVHVAPEVRGGGVGGLLVEHAVALAWEWGCYRVQLTSNVARTDAHRFYARHGFVASHAGFKRLRPVPD